MRDDEIRGLLGGYATGTLTPEEKDGLYRAALEDPALFEALADEQALRELLDDSSARAELLAAVEDQRFSVLRSLRDWFERPRSRVITALGAVALIAIVVNQIIERPITPTRGSRQPSFRSSSVASPIHYTLLRRTNSAASDQPVSPDYPFAATDRVRVRFESSRDGTLRVRSGDRVLYAGPISRGEPVITSEITFTDEATSSLDVQFVPADSGASPQRMTVVLQTKR